MHLLAIIVCSFILSLTLFTLINKLWCFWCKSKVCLVGKTALVTGAASGMGFQVALDLAARGCRVIMADVANLSRAVEEIKKITHNQNVVGKALDLRSFDKVRKFAKDINETEPHLHILMCIAGIGEFRGKALSEDGLDRTMQVNYFSHFMLTHLLIDLLKKSAPSRVIFTSSIVAYLSDMTVDLLDPPANYYEKFYTKLFGGVYSNSKLTNAAAAQMFTKRLRGSGVMVNSVIPGGVKTPIWQAMVRERNFMNYYVIGLVYLYGKTPQEGAQTLIHVATSDELTNVSGECFYEGMKFVRPPQLSSDFCDKLWNATVEITKMHCEEISC